MKWLLACVVIAAMAWAGWWFAGARTTETLMTGWLEERRTDGWVVNYASLNTAGFPSRFDTTISDIELADPATGVAWRTPFVQLLSLSYRPNHLIAIFAPEQTLATPLQRMRILARDMRASLVVAPDTKLAVQRATIGLEGLSIASEAGWAASVETAQLATRMAAAPFAHDISVQAAGLVPSEPVLRALDPAGQMPTAVTNITVDGTATFDAAWDLDALERARPALTRLDLRKLEAVWGGIEVRVAGSFDVDAAGIPEGELAVQIVNWRDLVDLLQANGTLPERMAPLALGALEALAGVSGRPDTLDAPLTLRGGTVRFGPIPIGRTPRLILR
jgi:hypothetical protein